MSNSDSNSKDVKQELKNTLQELNRLPNNSRQVSKWINKDAIRKNCPCLIALREPGKVFCDSGQF